MKQELLRMEGIICGEHGQKTLDDFNMVLYQGEILGVFSNHAAVKNDLIALIAGQKSAHSGRLFIAGEPCLFEDADRHIYRQVGVIHSTKTLVDDLSISENIFVIRKGIKSQIIDARLLHAQTRQLMEEFELSIEPESLVRNISSVERCILEIVKAVALGARIVALQDLSSFLSDLEIEQLLYLVEPMRHKGVAFLMVGSAISLLANYADRVTVIKNGRNFWTFGRGEVNDDLMASCFSKAQLIDFPGEALAANDGDSEKPVALVFDQVQAGDLDALSFTLHQGEELCIFDQDGKGIEAIKALLSGEQRADSGRILVGGKRLTARNLWQALNQKIAFVVENPADTMLFPDFTAVENLCYPSSTKTAGFWLNPMYLSSCLREYAQYFAPGVLKRYPSELSTQDLHKLVYCRWHLYNPKLVVCVKPFNSVEKSLEEISAFFIGLLLKKGIAVLILTSNAPETGITCRKISINQKNAPPHQKNDL